MALAERMHRDLVVARRWIDGARYREGLAFAQLAPGPLAAQLAMYIGWLRGGTLGAVAVGVAFILPAFVLVLGAAALYTRATGFSWVAGALYGAGPAVIAIVARSGHRLAVASLGRDRLLWLLCAVNFVVVAATRAENVGMVAASAILIWAIRSRGRHPLSTVTGLAIASLPVVATTRLGQMFWVFVKSGSIVFGSGLAIVPFLYGSVVAQHHWLDDRQFLDAVAIGLLSPGPMVITVAFMGYLIAGVPGALAGAVGVFLPVLLIVTIASPHVARITSNPNARAAVDGAVAAAIGSLLGAVVILAATSLTDPLTLAIAIGAVVALFATRRIPDVAVIAAAAIAGIVLHGGR